MSSKVVLLFAIAIAAAMFKFEIIACVAFFFLLVIVLVGDNK